MKSRHDAPGVLWLLGTIQYGVCLFGGGALWGLAACLTGGFGANPAAQLSAGLFLLALIGAEAAWAHLPDGRHPLGAFLVDCLNSAAIAGVGLALVLIIWVWVPR